MQKDLLAALTLDDLTGRDHEMAQAIGLEAFKALVTTYGGTEPYIPKAANLVIPIRNELIRREFNGGNYADLSMKWGLTERYIRLIVEAKAKEIRYRPAIGQLSLLGDDTEK